MKKLLFHQQVHYLLNKLQIKLLQMFCSNNGLPKPKFKEVYLSKGRWKVTVSVNSVAYSEETGKKAKRNAAMDLLSKLKKISKPSEPF